MRMLWTLLGLAVIAVIFLMLRRKSQTDVPEALPDQVSSEILGGPEVLAYVSRDPLLPVGEYFRIIFRPFTPPGLTRSTPRGFGSVRDPGDGFDVVISRSLTGVGEWRDAVRGEFTPDPTIQSTAFLTGYVHLSAKSSAAEEMGWGEKSSLPIDIRTSGTGQEKATIVVDKISGEYVLVN